MKFIAIVVLVVLTAVATKSHPSPSSSIDRKEAQMQYIDRLLQAILQDSTLQDESEFMDYDTSKEIEEDEVEEEEYEDTEMQGDFDFIEEDVEMQGN